MAGKLFSSVEVVFTDGEWTVLVREHGIEAQQRFKRAEHADSFAAGQRIRLGLTPSRSDIPQRSYLVTAA